MNKTDKKFITKEDLEKIYNKEKGYYNNYCWFEDLICNVCGKVIHNDGDEIWNIEQDYVGENLVTFCSKCVKLPCKEELIKISV